MDLSEKDIQLLKTAHNEELKEMKDGLDAKKKVSNSFSFACFDEKIGREGAGS